MSKQAVQGGKGCKKAGRNKKKCDSYRLENRRFKNKLRRIRRSNGEAAAEAYIKAQYLK